MYEICKGSSSVAGFDNLPNDAFMRPADVAVVLGVTERTLSNWRALRIHLPYSKIGGKAVRYRVRDVRDFMRNGTSKVEVS